jgi:hypothetical protein
MVWVYHKKLARYPGQFWVLDRPKGVLMLFYKTHLFASFGFFSVFALACTAPSIVKANQKGAIASLTDSAQKGDSPTVIIRSDYKPGEVTLLCQAAVQKLKGQLDQLVALKPEERNIHTTVLAFETMTDEFSDIVRPPIVKEKSVSFWRPFSHARSSMMFSAQASRHPKRKRSLRM